MTEPARDEHEKGLVSDLDLLIEMANDARHDDEAIHRHLESLKAKLDRFVHHRRSDSGGESAS